MNGERKMHCLFQHFGILDIVRIPQQRNRMFRAHSPRKLACDQISFIHTGSRNKQVRKPGLCFRQGLRRSTAAPAADHIEAVHSIVYLILSLIDQGQIMAFPAQLSGNSHPHLPCSRNHNPHTLAPSFPKSFLSWNRFLKQLLVDYRGATSAAWKNPC